MIRLATLGILVLALVPLASAGAPGLPTAARHVAAPVVQPVVHVVDAATTAPPPSQQQGPPPAPASPPAAPPNVAPVVDAVLGTAGVVTGEVSATLSSLPTYDATPPAPAAPAAAPAPAPPPARAAPPPPAPAPPPAAPIALVAAATALAPAAGSFSWDRLRRLFGAAALYTRIAKERLLDHGARERLLAAVMASPGAPLTDASRAAGIPRNTAVYHLFRLEREGLVFSVRNGRARLYFGADAWKDRERAPALAAVRHPVSRRIAVEVGAQPGVDQRALCGRFGLAPSLTHWHATRLESAGVVRKAREGRRVRYYPGEMFGVALGST